MANLRSPRYQVILCSVELLMMLLLLQTKQVLCYPLQYKVGDLDAWGIPTSANPHVYTNWPKNHIFKIGDSLLFLYPPSQDSLIQVTKESFNACNLKDPISYMNNGNSVFNITETGDFYFTSGENGHCEKKQRIQILVGNGSTADSPSYGPSALPETSSPSYQPVFGTIPAPPSSSPSLKSLSSLSILALVSLAAYTFITASI